MGFLITRGFIARGFTVGGYTAIELLGPGDLLQPWTRPEFEQSIAVKTEWTVVQRMRVAVLDQDFATRVSGWPEITAAIMRRVAWRTHWLLFQLAVSVLRRIDDRVVLVLWQFAGRWGRVTSSGVMLDLPLTHDLLAATVGARRPSVRAAVRRLVEGGYVRPLPRSRWLLLGEPPRDLDASEVARSA